MLHMSSRYSGNGSFVRVLDGPRTAQRLVPRNRMSFRHGPKVSENRSVLDASHASTRRWDFLGVRRRRKHQPAAAKISITRVEGSGTAAEFAVAFAPLPPAWPR